MGKKGSAGHAGTAVRIGSEWIGWSGQVAHPDSPMGGGGPGFFTRSKGTSRDDHGQPSPGRPRPLSDVDSDAVGTEQPRPANVPPATNPRTLDTVRKVQSTHVDVSIDAKIIADGTGGPENGAHTDFTWPASSAPTYDSVDGKITKFNGKLTWKGTIKIQTRYGTGASATTLSGYGRGTTEDDLKNRDITLGFHENCHQNDFVAYLASHELPQPPTLTIGMEATDYDTKAQEFADAVAAYRPAMDSDSEAKTDECGRKLSEVGSKGLYEHTLPPEE